MSTRVAALPMIAGPIISRRPSARRYSTVEQLPIVSLINVPLRSWVPLAVHVAAFLQGALPAAVYRSGLRSAWRRAALHKNATDFARDAVVCRSNSLGTRGPSCRS